MSIASAACWHAGIVTFRHPSTSSGGSHLGCILKGQGGKVVVGYGI